jgi:Kef-type K+ transport system membrane component KefB
MTLFTTLALLLISAHVLGAIAERFNQPALLGHMVAGVVLGPSILGWIEPTVPLGAATDVAVFFVVVTAGLEMRLQDVLAVFRGRGLVALALSFAIPAAAGSSLAFAFHLPLVPSLVLTLCISVTALPVALRILSSFGMLETEVARVAIAGALLSDVFVLIALGVVIKLAGTPDASFAVMVASSLARIVLLLGVVAACSFVCAKLIASTKWQVSTLHSLPTAVDSVSIMALLFVLSLGAASELLGLHFAIGAFLGALMVTRDLISDARFSGLLRSCELVTTALFAPLFLSYQGLQFKNTSLADPTFVISAILVAVFSKFLGGYLAGRFMKIAHRDAYGIAIVMNARGVMEMVVASIAYRAGLVDQALFSTLLIIGVVTTVITPFWLRRWKRDEPAVHGLRSAAREGTDV